MKCNASARKMGLSAHALASILLCILTILGEFFLVTYSLVLPPGAPVQRLPSSFFGWENVNYELNSISSFKGFF